MSEALVKRLREQRMSWVEVAPGKNVQIIRPTEIDMSRYLVKDGEVSVGYDEVKRFTVGWKGFTEADVLGAAVGASSEVAFTDELWAAVVADHVAWVRTVAQAILDAVIAYRNTLEADTKNS